MHSQPRSRRSLVACALAAAFGTTFSCSGSISRGSDASTMTLALTDAASDEISSFVVDLTALQLVREDGAIVSLLQSPHRIDLAALRELSHVLDVVAGPPALYTTVIVTIDFTHAACVLVGKSVEATILDGDGNFLTGSTTFSIEISGDVPAIAGRNRVVELDFDLDGSAEVDAAANEVSLEPILTMRLDRSDPKVLAMAGAWISVDGTAKAFGAELQTRAGSGITGMTVTVRDETIYQVNGVAAAGPAGLSALAGAGAGTWMQWYGAVDPERRRIDATYVEAGIGTYNGGTDIVEGHVIGRIGGPGSDATLTVLGTGENAVHTSIASNASFTVVTSFADTRVLRSGSADLYDTDDLNIGQRLRVFGTLTGTQMDASGEGNIVSVLPSHVLGFALGTSSGGTLTMDLSRVDLRTAEQFTWSEGGLTPPDPDALTVNVGGLADGLGIAAGTAVDASGFFAAVDDAQADFVADSVTNHDLGDALIVVRDRTGGMTLTPTIDDLGMTLDLSSGPAAGEVARLDKGFAGSIQLPIHPSPTLAPAEGITVFSIRDRDDGSSRVFTLYVDFADALLTELGRGAVIFDLDAVGEYEAAGNRMAASIIGVVLD